MLLVIGERIYNRNMNQARVAAWYRTWGDYGIRAALRTPAFVKGPARARLDRLIPQEKHVINLLPPDHQGGSWDMTLARTMAAEVKAYLPGSQYSGVVLLGRRVTDVFLDCACFGELWGLAGKTVLVLPHPSGQSRVWNEDGYEQRVRDEWVPDLMERIA